MYFAQKDQGAYKINSSQTIQSLENALIEARKSDLILVVIEGDLRSTETRTIRTLSKLGKRLLLVLNKIDLRFKNESHTLYEIIYRQWI